MCKEHLYVFEVMCEVKKQRKNKERVQVNNSQKIKRRLSVILRKFLFLVEFEPSDFGGLSILLRTMSKL